MYDKSLITKQTCWLYLIKKKEKKKTVVPCLPTTVISEGELEPVNGRLTGTHPLRDGDSPAPLNKAVCVFVYVCDGWVTAVVNRGS